jgi:cardiolipin synthase
MPGEMALEESAIYLCSEWAIRAVMLFYVPRKRSTPATRTWLLFIFFVPWPGLICYLLFGRIYVPRKRIEQQKHASDRIALVQTKMGAQVERQPELPANLASIVPLATKLGDFEPFGGNEIELFAEYEATLERLLADIRAAKWQVHLLFYIFEADETGRRVAEAVIEAARRGIECRLLLDAVGSRRGVRKFGDAFRAAGVEVVEMLPVGLFRRNAARFDLRNHRKIAVIDGVIGYTGSQNITDAVFVPGYPNEELMLRVSGPIVAQLQAVFLADRYIETDTTLELEKMFPNLAERGDAIAQIVPSGPGYGRENGQELMITMLYAARKRVVLVTPYFAPDDPFLQAVRAAERRGVEVHLVVSMHSNQRLTALAQKSYYEELLADGVEIHLYEPRFLHAKHLTIDDEIALVGSANLDIRSFALNAEINLVIYDRTVVAGLRQIQERYFAHSHQLTLEEARARSPFKRTLQSVARLADSLL